MVAAKIESVSLAHPCEVCKGRKRCSRTADGLHLCRQRLGERPGWKFLGPTKDDGWHQYREDTALARTRPPKPRPDPASAQPEAAAAVVERCVGELSDARRHELAGRLKLPAGCLPRLPGLGFSPGLGAWVFPEVDGDGRVIGLQYRYPDGTKRNLGGSGRGLTLPGGVLDAAHLYVVEGASDTLALLAVGLAAVGRPSADGGTGHLGRLLTGFAGAVTVVGENDRKSSGLWPGKDGAEKVAAALARSLGRAVSVALPPGGVKDVREWVAVRLADAADQTPDDLGREVAAELARTRTEVAPTPSLAQATPARFPLPVPIEDLQLPGAGGVNWVWDGFLARDAVTVLSALPKAGKTTLIGNLLAALPAGGEFCGRPLSAGRACVISEEPAGVWAARREAVGLRHLRLIVRGRMARCDAADWPAFLLHLAELFAADPCDLIVFDTLANLWPVRDENSAAEVGAALQPLHTLTQGRAVLLVHHLRKSDGAEGTGSRGSGALAGFVDVMAELRRAKPDGSGRRRVLTGYGRYDGIPPEWPVRLADDGRYHHDPAGREGKPVGKLADALRRALPATEAGAVTASTLISLLPADCRPSGTQNLLKYLHADGIRSTGRGKTGDPYRFWRPVVDGV